MMKIQSLDVRLSYVLIDRDYVQQQHWFREPDWTTERFSGFPEKLPREQGLSTGFTQPLHLQRTLQ